MWHIAFQMRYWSSFCINNDFHLFFFQTVVLLSTNLHCTAQLNLYFYMLQNLDLTCRFLLFETPLTTKWHAKLCPFFNSSLKINPGTILFQISNICTQSLLVSQSQPYIRDMLSYWKKNKLTFLHLIAATLADVTASTKSRKLQSLFHTLNYMWGNT